MWRRVAAIAAIVWSSSVSAAVWTDLWWNPNESGWGVNVVHQYDVVFLTFFVYGADSSPHWYSATATPGPVATSGYNEFDGDVYETHGPFLGAAFNPAVVGARKVGTARFIPATPYTATLAYTVDGVGVTKAIQRQTLRHIPISGNYVGGYSVKTSTCSTVAVGSYGTADFAIQANIGPDGVSGAMVAAVSFNQSPACVLAGSYKQYGSLYYIPDVVVCSSGIGTFSFTDFSSSDDSIDGNIKIQDGACSVVMGFSAARR